MQRSMTFNGAVMLLCATVAAGSAGCSQFEKIYKPLPEPAPMQAIAREADPPVDRNTSTNGSIYHKTCKMNLFGDDKACRTGDIVMVNVTLDNSGSKEANTDAKRSSKLAANIKYWLGLEDEVNELTGYETTPGAAWSPHDLVHAETNTEFAGEGTTVRKDDLKATVSAVVTDVLRNGNLVIYGHQTVTLNNEASVLTVQGIARPTDLDSNNAIDSKRLANANIEFTGSGVISDKQHPGWMSRVMDWTWPF